jgi:hypothetical protein
MEFFVKLQDEPPLEREIARPGTKRWSVLTTTQESVQVDDLVCKLRWE